MVSFAVGATTMRLFFCANSWLQQNQNPAPFQETFKILGEITDIQAISGLRALVYSEGQQMMGIIDNTLQLKEGLLAFFDVDF